MRDSHEDAATKEQWASPKPVHGPDARADTYELRDIQDSRHDELHAMVQAHGPEECRRIIDQGVDPNELLEEHESYADVRSPPAAAPEAVRPRGVLKPNAAKGASVL